MSERVFERASSVSAGPAFLAAARGSTSALGLEAEGR